MPKQILKINQFHGGLNSNSDARDVADNELTEAVDVMVDELGKVRLLGGIAAHGDAPANAAQINPGYGLFQFSHDRLGASITGTGQAETGDDYLAMADVSTAQIDIYSLAADAWGTNIIDLGTTHAGMKAVFYAADGALRVSDGNFGAANQTMWYGYIYRYFFGDNVTGLDVGMTNGVLVSTWHLDEAAPKALAIKNFCGNYDDPAGTDQSGTDNFPTAANPVTVDVDPQGTAWVDVSTASTTIPPGADSIKTKVSITSSTTVAVSPNIIPGFSDFCSVGDKILIKQAEHVTTNNKIFTVKALTADPDIITFEEVLGAATDDFCFMFNLSRSSWFDPVNQGWEAAVSTLYDDSKQESALSASSTVVEPIDLTQTFETAQGGNMAKLRLQLMVYASTSDGIQVNHKRVSGFKVYMRRQNTSIWYLQAEIDITKGIKWFQRGDHEMWESDQMTTCDNMNASILSAAQVAFFDELLDEDTNYFSFAGNNGDGGSTLMDSDGFIQAVGTTFAHSGGYGNFINSGSAAAHSYLPFTSVAGKSYVAEMDVSSGGDSNIEFTLSDTTSWNATYTSGSIGHAASTTDNRTGVNFIASDTTSFLHIRNIETSSSKFSQIDNLVIREDANNIAFCNGEYLDAPRQIETYESETNYDSSIDTVGFDGVGTGFKTAVTANRKAYVGNVTIKDWRGITQTYGDAILKSAVNKFDSFSLDNRIEATVRDGDEIVKLEEYADRLLQFKKKRMELINISQEVEFLEDTFLHKGVSHPAATCKTDFGIAWVNKLGCYLYDGQKVHNLLEKKGRQIIKESEWLTFTTNDVIPSIYEPIIGYIPKKRQLLIADDNSDDGTGKTFLYDLVTQSWVKGADATITSNELTNFITDWNGDLVYAHTDGAGTVVKWSDASIASNTLDLKTKDIDFGQPGQTKRIHKVIITHRSAGTSKVKFQGEIMSKSATSGQGIGELSNDFTFGTLTEDTQATNWKTETFTPPATDDDGYALSLSNVYSIRLYVRANSDTVPAGFEINDISIVYRLKGVR